MGQLTALHEALERDTSSVLLKFVADPPTTTQQRLKVRARPPKDLEREFGAFSVCCVFWSPS